MTGGHYLGLDRTDIPCCYRHRAQALADAGRRPATAVVVEYEVDGTPNVLIWGATADLSARECAAILLQTVALLADTAAGFNAEASN